MHLAYIDDSGSDKQSPVVVVGAIVIDDVDFAKIDIHASAIVEVALPPDKLEQFEEFHAADLFGGYNLFKDVSQDERFAIIRGLLAVLIKGKTPF